MNKKADRFLGEHTVNLVITVIVVVILIYLVVKVYGIFTERNKLEKITGQFEKIIGVINDVRENEGEKKIEVFGKDLYLSTFPFAFPEGECRGKKSCLCLCDSPQCSDPRARKCNGFDFDVKVRGFVRTPSQRETGERYSIVIEEKESIKLPSIGELAVINEENKISIYGESYGQVDEGQVIYYKIE